MKICFATNNTNLSKIYYPSFHSTALQNPLKNDVFVKREHCDFLLKPSKEILQCIKQSIKSDENLLGSGGEAEVWKIKDTNYCVRVPRKTTFVGKLYIKKTLSEEDKINHTVAKLSNGATIMPIIKGVTFSSDNIDDYEVAKLIENMPVSSFRDLIEQINYAETKTDLIFDVGWKNVIIDSNKNKMTAIDFYKSEDKPLFTNQILSNVFATLTSNPKTSVEQKKICAGKIILATIQFLDTKNNNFSTLGVSRFVETLKKRNLFENIKYAKVLESNLNKLKSNNPNTFRGASKVLTTLVRQLF